MESVKNIEATEKE